MKRYRICVAALLAGSLAACSGADTAELEAPAAAPSTEPQRIEAGYGTVEVYGADNPFISDIVDLGGAFGWSEGPVWIQEGGYLLFTDVPGNAIHKFDPATGDITEWMNPSGPAEVTDEMSSAGANGLLNYGEGRILVPVHGERALFSMDLATKTKTPLATEYKGKRFSSPNDVVVLSDGTIFFTDPPYGLNGQDDSAAKALDFNGVFKLKDGELTVVEQSLRRPNGIVVSPDEQYLYVSEALPEEAAFLRYPINGDGTVGKADRVLDVSAPRAEANFGNPDGMAVSTDGTIFATGPGGIWVLDKNLRTIAKLVMPKPCANAAFGGATGSTLYLTCYDRLVSVETNRTGLEFASN